MCRPNLFSIILFIFHTAVYHRLHTIIERKNIKTLIAWFRLHVRTRICSTDLKLFSMRQHFLYSSGTSFMVRFMYHRSTFVAYVRYSHLLLPFFSLRRFFITSQNLNVVPSPDLISYLDVAPLLPQRNSETAFLIPGVLLTAIRNLSPHSSRKRITSTLLNSRSMRIIDFFNPVFLDSESSLRTNSIFETSSVTRTTDIVGNCSSVTTCIAAYVSNRDVPPLGLPLITRRSLCLSAPVNGIRCLSMASM